MTEKEAYLKDLETRLNEARARIEELKAGLSKTEGDRAQYDKKIKELGRHLRSLEKETNKLRNSSEEELSMDLKTGLEETWNTFKVGVSVVDEMGKRATYLRELDSLLDEGRARVRELEAKADKAEGDAKARHTIQLESLRSKLTLAEDKVNEIRTSRGEVWESLKEGFENAWDQFKSGFADTSSGHN